MFRVVSSLWLVGKNRRCREFPYIAYRERGGRGREGGKKIETVLSTFAFCIFGNTYVIYLLQSQ